MYINIIVYYLEGLENNIYVLERETREWKQENEKLIQKVKALEDEAVVKNAKLLELGNLFLIPQFEVKSIFIIFNVKS